jgi:hypothetical protein
MSLRLKLAIAVVALGLSAFAMRSSWGWDCHLVREGS